MPDLLRDMRYALRRLLRTPGFTAVVVLTLALGIGANSAIFSVVNAVLLRDLPYREPERLVSLHHFYASLNALEAPVSAPGFRDYSARTQDFSSAAVITGWTPTLTGHGDPERVPGAQVSARFFSTLGTSALVGRAFTAGDDQPTSAKTIVLSHGLWQRVFGGRPDAVGQTVRLNGDAYQVIGVMRPDFKDVFRARAQFWTPLVFAPDDLSDNRRTNEYLGMVARLAPGVTPEAVQRDLTAYANQLRKDYPDAYGRDWTLKAKSLHEETTGNVRASLFILLGAVGFVLLIACANVANLLLARGASRLKDVAVRNALGATSRHLLRELLAEALILSLAGAALGLAIAFAVVRYVRTANPANLPRVDEIGIDGKVLVFTLGVSLLTSVVFALTPAWQALRASTHDLLKEGGRSNAADRTGGRLRRALIVSEFAMALALLIGAGLLLKSFVRVQEIDPGFATENLLTFDLALPQTKYPNDTLRLGFYEAALPALAAVPGIVSVGATSVMPLNGDWSTSSFSVEGYETVPNQPGPWGDYRVATPEYFTTLKIPLKRGRLFTEQDRAGSPRVSVVDEEWVRRFSPTRDPIGRRLTYGDPTDSTARWIEVVGVVAHAKQERLDAESRVQVYIPLRQNPQPFMVIAARTRGEPAAMVSAARDALRTVDRDIAVSNVATMTAMIGASTGQRRFSAVLLAFFAALALLLASIGIYGLMSYSVTQRSRELGVRIALGAERSSVLGLVMRQGMTLALAGVVLGLLGAFALTRLLASQLYDVRPTDPLTFALVTVVLTTVAAIATLVPALRATRVDPVTALREE